MGYGPRPEHVCSVCDQTFLEDPADVDHDAEGRPLCAECAGAILEGMVSTFEQREDA